MKMKLLRGKNWKVFFISRRIGLAANGLSFRAADPCGGHLAGFG